MKGYLHYYIAHLRAGDLPELRHHLRLLAPVAVLAQHLRVTGQYSPGTRSAPTSHQPTAEPSRLLLLVSTAETTSEYRRALQLLLLVSTAEPLRATVARSDVGSLTVDTTSCRAPKTKPLSQAGAIDLRKSLQQRLSSADKQTNSTPIQRQQTN